MSSRVEGFGLKWWSWFTAEQSQALAMLLNPPFVCQPASLPHLRISLSDAGLTEGEQLASRASGASFLTSGEQNLPPQVILGDV